MVINLSVDKDKWSSTLSDLLKTQVQHDLHLICADGTVNAHRIILAQHSKFLRDVIQDRSMLTYENGLEVAKVILVGVERAIAFQLINLFYRGEVFLNSLEEYNGFLALFQALQMRHVDLLDVSSIAVDDVLEIVCSDDESFEDSENFASENIQHEKDPLSTDEARTPSRVNYLTNVPKPVGTWCPPRGPENTYSCFCKRTFGKFSRYKDHLYRTHYKRQIEATFPQIGLSCRECGKEFLKEHQVRRHFFVCHDHVLKFVPKQWDPVPSIVKQPITNINNGF
ncbi:hypothetical protein TCAL_15019 [Tigriopus californicus]|uniref:BTB domain-containing protein n=1 Tax=Tigriopus californicus TaxID=6832 RepID=A0A553NZC1_TIGCA|nr:hypothetical protein TCAL_15019 [Tigriopus californicus]